MFLYLIVYRNENGKLFYRLRTTLEDLKIGKKTSMNWEVIDIQKFYKKRFYTIDKYINIYNKESKNYIRKRKKIEKAKSIIEILHKTFK